MTEKPTALARVEKSIGDLLGGPQAADQIKLAMAASMTPERFFRVALTAMNKTPKLKDCTQSSLAEAMMDCGQVGLVPDGRLAHLIPYGKKCTLIIDWKGYVQLARKSGEISIWKAELICDKDEFIFNRSVVESHKINFRQPRGKPYAVYSYVKFKDGTEDYEVMTEEEIEIIRSKSPAGKSGPWIDNKYEMWKKTAMRRHSKRLPLGDEFQVAQERDFDSAPALDITSDITDHGSTDTRVDDLQPEAKKPEAPDGDKDTPPPPQKRLDQMEKSELVVFILELKKKVKPNTPEYDQFMELVSDHLGDPDKLDELAKFGVTKLEALATELDSAFGE